MSFDIAVMQAFNGLSLFTVLALMALGLAIVFGLMGVINMPTVSSWPWAPTRRT